MVYARNGEKFRVEINWDLKNGSVFVYPKKNPAATVYHSAWMPDLETMKENIDRQIWGL